MVTIVPKKYLAITPDIELVEKHKPRVPVFALGMSVGAFLAITFVLCVGFDLLFPNLAMHAVWQPLLPAFTWLSWPSFFLGLVESFAYGWYIALIFAPLFNFFAARSRQHQRN